jgi:hypothetical protein
LSKLLLSANDSNERNRNFLQSPALLRERRKNFFARVTITGQKEVPENKVARYSHECPIKVLTSREGER